MAPAPTGPSRTPHFPGTPPPPVAPRFAYDDAVRADQGPPPSSSWSTDPFGYGAAGFSVTSGLFTPAAGVDHEMKWVPDLAFGPYLSLAIDVPVLPLTGETVSLSVMQTWALASFTGYQLKFVAPSTFTLYRDDTAVAVTLATGGHTFLAGDTLNIRITPTTVEAWVGSGGVWTMVLQSSDTTYRSSAFGVGVYVQNTTARLNNFLVVNDAVATQIVPRPTSAVAGQSVQSGIRRHLRGQVIEPSVQAAAAAVGTPVVSPIPKPTVLGQAALAQSHRSHTRGQVVSNRWPGYQWVGLPPVTPLPRQVVVTETAVGTSAAQQNRARPSNIYQTRSTAEATFATPTKSIVVTPAEQAGTRRAHRGSIITNRWPGLEWVGLAPVTPTPRQVVQDAAAVWQAREDHRRGLIVAPPVQLAAVTAGAAPVTPPLPKQVVLDRAAFQPKRQQHAGLIVAPAVQRAAAVAPPPPTVTPPRTVYLVQAAQQPRQHRRGTIIAPRPVQGVTTRPVVTVVAARPPSVQTRRHGCVTAPRRVTAPVVPPRPTIVHPAPPRRRRRGSVITWHGRFVQTGGPTTLITTPATGYVTVGDIGVPAAGDTAYPQGVMDGLAPSLLLAPSLTLAPSQGGATRVGITSPVIVGASGIVTV